MYPATGRKLRETDLGKVQCLVSEAERALAKPPTLAPYDGAQMIKQAGAVHSSWAEYEPRSLKTIRHLALFSVRYSE